MSKAIKHAVAYLLLAGFATMLAGACSSSPRASLGQDDELVGRAHKPLAKPVELRPGELWYQLVVGSEQMTVRMRLLQPAARTSFFLPGPWAGQNDFAEDISISGASGPMGALPLTIQRSLGRIDVETPGVAWVELHYTVKLHDKDAERLRYRSRLRDEVFFAYGPTFLILPSDGISRLLRDIPVEVRVPADWEVVTTWRSAHVGPSKQVPSTNVHGFIVDDVRSLRDAFVAAGRQIEAHHLAIGTERMTIAFEPGFTQRSALVEAIAAIVAAYSARYGSQGEVSAFIGATDRMGPDAMRGMGRRGGFVLELPLDVALDDQTLLLIAHEAFHMWNGHELVPEPVHERQTRWFKEGLTHYVALQTLRELGLIEEHTVRAGLAQAAQFYNRNPAIRGVSTAGIDQVRLPYDQGMLLALKLDVAIRAASGSRLSLKHWLMDLLLKARHAPGHYDQDALKRSLLGLVGPSGSSLGGIWDRHINRQVPINVAELFESIGLHWIEGSDSSLPRLLPFEAPNSMYGQLFKGPE
ncbi:MAG: hypothetical protein H0U74_22615 [Bradymonadaceae bacterium]|nr:hypothetical protein [Lujinxingiaceae bacterium]